MSKWADLPDLILSEIMRRLSFYNDFVIFGAICKSWRSVYSSENPPLSPRCPWLMLAEEKEQKSRTDFQVNLFHPLSKHLLSLPQPLFWNEDGNSKLNHLDYRDMFFEKCVLSRNPWNSVTHEYDCDCIIMVIYGNGRSLAFTRPGYKAWIDIPSHSGSISDITFYNGKFYAVNCHGEAFVCHTDDDIPFVESIAPHPPATEEIIQMYIVESSGDLLVVSRFRGGHFFLEDDTEDEDSEDDIEDENIHESEGEGEGEDEEEKINDNPYVTIGFTILKLECSTKVRSKYKYKWGKVDSLGDQALFVGDNSSVSLSASSFNGCKANCIYYTDDYVEVFPFTLNGGGYDMGVFSVEDGEYKHHYEGESLSY
ncbi:putative f-box protein [Quercus suber]|uniref:F-box protein n=1 Tax=Quercus suber TaxID=58331 RepID=A0AAW0JZ49_QUESU